MQRQGEVDKDQENTTAIKIRAAYEKKIGKPGKKEKIEGSQNAKSQEGDSAHKTTGAQQV